MTTRDVESGACRFWKKNLVGCFCRQVLRPVPMFKGTTKQPLVVIHTCIITSACEWWVQYQKLRRLLEKHTHLLLSLSVQKSFGLTKTILAKIIIVLSCDISFLKIHKTGWNLGGFFLGTLDSFQSPKTCIRLEVILNWLGVWMVVHLSTLLALQYTGDLSRVFPSLVLWQLG